MDVCSFGKCFVIFDRGPRVRQINTGEIVHEHDHMRIAHRHARDLIALPSGLKIAIDNSIAVQSARQ